MFENHPSEEKAEFVQIEMRTFESDQDYAMNTHQQNVHVKSVIKP